MNADITAYNYSNGFQAGVSVGYMRIAHGKTTRLEGSFSGLFQFKGEIDAKSEVDIKMSEQPIEWIFEITGMSCGNCATRIEKSLLSMSDHSEDKQSCGVAYAAVSCVTNTAIVIVSNERFCIRDIITKIESLGYGCRYRSSGIGSPLKTEASNWVHSLNICLFFGLPVLALHLSMALSEKIFDAASRSNKASFMTCYGGLTYSQVFMLLLNLPIQFIGGYRYYQGAYLGALNGSYGMDFLITTGTSIIFLYSLFEVYLSCSHLEPVAHTYFEAAGMLLMFVTTGKYFEARTKSKSAGAIEELLKCQPKNALLVVKGDTVCSSSSSASAEAEVIQEINAELVKVGDVLKVLPGASFPADGVLTFTPSSGAYIDTSLITGESAPVHLAVGASVHGSTVNLKQLVYMRVTASGVHSTLAQIVKVVQTAQLSKAPIQAYADRIAGIFAPCVLLLAVCTFATWYSLCLWKIVPIDWYIDSFGSPFLFALLFSVSVVVTSCPCALGLATPMALVTGCNMAASIGLLVKGGAVFELAHKLVYHIVLYFYIILFVLQLDSMLLYLTKQELLRLVNPLLWMSLRNQKIVLTVE
jgi:Cu+-exporting ATPase